MRGRPGDPSGPPGRPGDHCHRVTAIVPLNLHSESDLQACPSRLLSSASAQRLWGGAGSWPQRAPGRRWGHAAQAERLPPHSAAPGHPSSALLPGALRTNGRPPRPPQPLSRDPQTPKRRTPLRGAPPIPNWQRQRGVVGASRLGGSRGAWTAPAQVRWQLGCRWARALRAGTPRSQEGQLGWPGE